MTETKLDPAGPGESRSDFIRDMIDADLEAGKYPGVVTRFPPEPNGYPHIGHAKSICLNFGLARDYGGVCHLRFDDTNPATESPEYVDAIQRDIRWLGFDWGDKLFFASDYFEKLYEYAEQLIQDGKAYVDHLGEEEIREYRGTVTEPGRNSPYRDRSPEENLDLFRRMRAGEFEAGDCVLRAKIDMAAANMKMRDPLLYRIRKAHHYRTGDAWCIYPMYDYAHCLSDAIENISHSLCTLEFENNRDVYDWVLDELGFAPRPYQTEFARLNLGYTVVSKRHLLTLVKEGHVAGWDDPRMPTLSGLRRRGYTPAAIRNFCDRVGVAKANSLVDVAQLEHSIRDDLNHKAPRVLCVLRPLKVVITNYPEGESEEFDAPSYPHDVPKEGSRPLPFSREVYVERDDFRENPPKGFHRLAPGREVRLRYAWVIRCEEVIKDSSGEVTELRCTYDPATRGGTTPDGRRIPGTLHWVSAAHALPVEVRLYDRLFSDERPGLDGREFKDSLNPDSLEVVATARIEPSVAGAAPGEPFQFERQGYFCVDPDSTPERLVFNRTVTLKDTWARQETRAAVPPPAAAPAAPKPARTEGPKPAAREFSPEERERLEALERRHDLSEAEAARLLDDAALESFFERAVAAGAPSRGVARWTLHELLGLLSGRAVAEVPFGPEALAELVHLVEDGTLSGPLGKEVLAEMLASGQAPGAIVEARGLRQVGGGALEAAVAAAIAANPSQVAEYRAGKQALLGYFVGQVMKATGGRANPQQTRELLQQKLAAE